MPRSGIKNIFILGVCLLSTAFAGAQTQKKSAIKKPAAKTAAAPVKLSVTARAQLEYNKMTTAEKKILLLDFEKSSHESSLRMLDDQLPIFLEMQIKQHPFLGELKQKDSVSYKAWTTYIKNHFTQELTCKYEDEVRKIKEMKLVSNADLLEIMRRSRNGEMMMSIPLTGPYNDAKAAYTVLKSKEALPAMSAK